jgi:hypothetical protein
MRTTINFHRGDTLHVFANADMFDLEVVHVDADESEVIVNHLGDMFYLSYETFADWSYSVTAGPVAQ